MEFAELAPPEQVRALAEVLKFLARHECASLEIAAERLGVPADEVWGRISRDAGLPETAIPWHLIGVQPDPAVRLDAGRAALLDLLRRPAGTTEPEALTATGWARCLGTMRRTAREVGLMLVITENAEGARRYYAIPPGEIDALRVRRADETLLDQDRADTVRLAGSRVHKVTLGHMIETGYLKAPLAIEADHAGRSFAARIEADGTIAFDGRSFASPSSAGSTATGEIACPGWAFWRYRDPLSGDAAPLSDLRQLVFG